jgi:hypothetical protein
LSQSVNPSIRQSVYPVIIFYEMTNPLNPRRLAFGAARKFLYNDRDPEAMLERIAGIDRYGNVLPPSPSLENIMSRSRDRILANLDDMYTEAFERAKAADDKSQMASLDFAYRREQLYFEILLDVRDALERR